MFANEPNGRIIDEWSHLETFCLIFLNLQLYLITSFIETTKIGNTFPIIKNFLFPAFKLVSSVSQEKTCITNTYHFAQGDTFPKHTGSDGFWDQRF